MRTLGTLVHKFWRYLGRPGSLYPLDANGEEFELTVPADWAAQEANGTPYFLGISPTTGLPAWRTITDATFGSDGFGTAFGAAFGES